MISVTLLVVFAGFIATVASALGKCPLWVAVLFLNVAMLLQFLPR